MSTRRFTRRNFLAAASSTAAMISASPAVARGAAGANDRIGIGLVGVGGRGTAHLNDILKFSGQHNVEIAAICDVWRINRDAAAVKLSKATGKTPWTFSRYEEMLKLKDVDAVVVATPDFAHMPITIAALEAGKDVYVEKPMSLSVEEANRAMDLARAKQRVVQVGTQHRSDGRYRAVQKEVATGSLGKISRVSISVGFNQPRWYRPSVEDCKQADVDWDAFLLRRSKRPFDARLLRCWQLYKFCTNGLAGLWMTHYADLVHLITGAKYPSSGVAHGGIYVWKDGREHTDTFRAVLEYPEGFLMDWGMSLGNNSGITMTIHGTEGTLDVERQTISAGDKTAPRKIPPEPPQHHMANWLECLRTRKTPAADIACGHQHTVATVMAAQALNTGRRQAYDMEKKVLRPG